MIWIDLITVLALLQYVVFGVLVARAHKTYGVQPPAMTGHPVFERYYRVQMNTLELLVVFLPALWLASNYWEPGWLVAAGAMYLVGRVIYCRAYVSDPSTRTFGFALSVAPIVLLLAAVVVGIAITAVEGLSLIHI